MAGFTIARLVTAGLLLLALARLPYGFYTLMRLLCCVVCAYGTYVAVERRQRTWMWTFGVVALLFNPFLPIRLDRSTWAIVDVCVALLMLWSCRSFRS
jgi:hypothetical protein